MAEETISTKYSWLLYAVITVLGTATFVFAYGFHVASWDSHRLNQELVHGIEQESLFIKALSEMVQYHCKAEDGELGKTWTMRIPLNSTTFSFACQGEEKTFELEPDGTN